MFLKIEIQNELPPLQHPTIISEVLLCLIAAARYDAPLGPTGLDDALCARTADLIVHFQGDPCLRGSPCPSEMGSEEDAILESHADARHMPSSCEACLDLHAQNSFLRTQDSVLERNIVSETMRT